MYAIVKAEKGSYDSNIKIDTLGKYNKKPLANDSLIDLLVDELLIRMNDNDLEKYIHKYDDENLLKDEIRKDVLDIINSRTKEIKLTEESIYLAYNKIWALNSFTIPCSSLSEYQGKTVSIISFQ